MRGKFHSDDADRGQEDYGKNYFCEQVALLWLAVSILAATIMLFVTAFRLNVDLFFFFHGFF